MYRSLLALAVLVGLCGPASAQGLLVPTEKSLPPLAMVNHDAKITIEDQVAVTHVEQAFRNHTDRQLEATYIFPVPKGASVRKFSMWVNGKEEKGELVEADKARKIYTDIVRQTQDPGLLEYMGNDLLRLRVFPVPPRGDQKVAISYTSITPSDNGLVGYMYPLKTDGKVTKTLEKFSINVKLKSQHPIQNIYSPTHAITMLRPNDREAVIGFEKEQALLDKDFQLFYSAVAKDVGVTALAHRPAATLDGYFMMLVSPRAQLSKEQMAPRDVVMVLDTSGSMRGKRIEQAKAALKYVLKNLDARDRFALINFATTVNKYHGELQPATPDNLAVAAKWVDGLEASGGTAINDALAAALGMRTSDMGRTFTLAFFTDGQPTIGETNVETILKNVTAKNTSNTRIFTFGVGDDLNATLLDRLAEQSRAVSTFVREAEDIEAKVSSFYAKISSPVLTDLKIEVSPNVKLAEIYPAELPDLFDGSQLVVFGKYKGKGHAAIKLTGKVGKETKEFVYEIDFPEKTAEGKEFVEDLWARRKVGFMLDQIRINGEKKELVDEVVFLAKRYGITTPYTSYLIVPDAAVPIVRRAVDGKPDVRFFPGAPAPVPPALQAPGAKGAAARPVADFIKSTTTAGTSSGSGGATAGLRNEFAQKELEAAAKKDAKGDKDILRLQDASERWNAYNLAKEAFKDGDKGKSQTGKLGVDLSCYTNGLRQQERLSQTATRRIGDRNALEVGGVWIDEAYDPKMTVVTIKAQSDAYFRLLERQPSMRDILRIGNHLVYVTPSGTALVIDAGSGSETMSDADIDRLFVAQKK